ncbi:transcriptional repressor TCF25-domain-containing protein [Bisporella sp. PMI_857]|nr:transcriptional repressor TCF25-domain-containing protein [Bisporella sp. PMI_857]
MSSRALRKLQREKEIEQANRLAAAEEEEASAEGPICLSSGSTRPSLFAGFAALETGDEEKDAESEPELSESTSQPVSVSAPKAKKSKKKKKGKGKVQAKEKEKEILKDDSDEIDAVLRELDLRQRPSLPVEPTISPAEAQWERICSLLKIQTQHLKVAHEMRNLFGRAATGNHDDAGGRVGRQHRQRDQHLPVDLETALRGRHVPGQGLPEVTLRRNPLIQGKDTWPRGTTGGLTMGVVGEVDKNIKTIEFRFEHNEEYQRTQQIFQGLVEMGDPQNLVGLLIKNPYHISSLIQVSKIAKDQGDHALSSDLLERALFTFGRAGSSLFSTKLIEGKARLSFSRPENREIWLAGYQYIKSLIMKGTYRTAFEWAKLLLSLDPENDPYSMRLTIHHLALRAHQFDWLLEISDDETALQNWIPDLSLQRYTTYHITPSFAFAALQLKDGPRARKLLSNAMQRLPWLFVRLFSEIDLDAPQSIWGAEARTDAEMLFTDLYIQQMKDLWNTPEATSLLMEIAHTIPKVDVDLIPKVGNEEMTPDIVRFIYLDNTPALMARVPGYILHQENNSDSDPIPPSQNIFSYESQRAALDQADNNPVSSAGLPGPIARLFRLLYNGRQPGAHQGADDDSQSDGPDDAEMPNANNILELQIGEGEQGQRIQVPQGLANRFMQMLFGSGSRQNDAEEHQNEDTDTDFDGMPDLEEPIDDGESDDEMPPLIDSDGELPQ